MNTRNIVKNIRSKELNGNGPKLPTSGQLDYGEIAVNYKKGYETLSLKNDNNEIVSLSVNTVNDVTVNGTSVVSDKTAGITMKGETIPVADTYTTTTYPSPFESKAEHISATDKVNVALKKVETNISKLVSEVVDNENVVSEAISKLANSAGTIDGSNNIKYIKETNAHYISDATSVHDATVKLDSKVYTNESSVNTLGNEVITIKGNVNTIKGDVNALKGRVNTIESNVTSIGGKVTYLENNIGTLTSDVSNLKTQVTNLDSKYSNLNNTDINLQDQINSLRGLITTLQGQISSIPTMEFVDLGLPSGTMWAKCNIGASTETDYGNYYMWGSTTPNTASQCIWSNAPFNNGASDYDETYFNSVKNTVCPNGILAKGYDVAYKTTNGAARMPTQAEFQELLDNTTKEWTQVESVNGWKFTSKTDTSKYIFIPAAGYYSGGSFDGVSNSGDVWSSSLDTSNPFNAWYLSFYSDNCHMSNDNRYYGRSVRAVRNLPL